MAIPKITKQNIIDALKFIDENRVPFHNQSTKYELVSDDGKKYPPKYVVAVAAHIADGTDISVENIHGYEARDFLESQGFVIETKQQEKFKLSITAETVESTDERFTMNNLSLGDNYKPLDAYFKKADGEIVKRSYSKGERRNSNQTLPRIACQVFEKGFKYPLQKKRSGGYKIQSGEMIRVCMTSDFFLEQADEWRADSCKASQRADIGFRRRNLRLLVCAGSDEGSEVSDIITEIRIWLAYL